MRMILSSFLPLECRKPRRGRACCPPQTKGCLPAFLQPGETARTRSVGGRSSHQLALEGAHLHLMSKCFPVDSELGSLASMAANGALGMP